AATAALKGKVVGCVVRVYNDRSFDFEVKSSPASVLIKEAAGVEKGSGVPNKDKVGKITKAQVKKIAQAQMADLNSSSIESAMRGSLSLPKGIGKSKRVVAFCQSDKVADAMAAGAVKAGGEELVAEIEKGWMDFDVAVASPDMMRVISKLGKVLGPKGLMPSPKSGTVTQDIPAAVKEYSAGKVEYRNDKGGNVHAVIGKMSFKAEDLAANL